MSPPQPWCPQSTEVIERLLTELKKEYTIVVVTHNMAQAQRVSDTTAFFYVEELIEYRPASKLFEHPEQEKTQRYVSAKFG